MEEKEMMTNEEFIEEEMDEETEGRSGMPTGVAMLLGGGITLGVIAGVKKLKKVWDKRKATKDTAGVIKVVKSEDESERVEIDSEEID